MSVNLLDLTVGELRRMAHERGISGRSEMNKQQLVDALQDQDLSARVAALENRVASLEQRTRRSGFIGG